jgi:predicted CopG family antitoxin
MMPTIRIDDDVYRALQEQAQAFVDSPNSVLRRILDLDDEGDPGTHGDEPRRARSGELLDRREYDRRILEVLTRHGGSAPGNDVIDEVGEMVKDRLTELDKESIPSGVLRWRNRVAWRRFNLVKQGLLKSDSPRGLWELSDEGWAVVREQEAQ